MDPQTQELLRQARAASTALADVPDDVLIEAIGKAVPEATKYAGFKGDFLGGELSRGETVESQAAAAEESGVGVMGPVEQLNASLQSGAERLGAAFANFGSDVLGADLDKAWLATQGKYSKGFGDGAEAIHKWSDELQKWADASAGDADLTAQMRDVSQPGYVQSAANLVAEALPSVAPSVVAGPAGMPAVLAATGLTSYASTAHAVEREMMDLGASRKEAEQIAHAEGAMAGLVTTLITAGFNRAGIGGLESLLARKSAREAAEATTKSAFRSFLSDAWWEFAEESLDQAAQGVVERFVRHPDKSVWEILQESGVAGLLGGVMGGGFNLGALSVGEIRKRTTTKWAEDKRKEIQERDKARLDKARTKSVSAKATAAAPTEATQEATTSFETSGAPVETTESDAEGGKTFVSSVEATPSDIQEGQETVASFGSRGEPVTVSPLERPPTPDEGQGVKDLGLGSAVGKPAEQLPLLPEEKTTAPSKEEELADLEQQGLKAREEIKKKQAKIWKQDKLDTRGEGVYYHGAARPFTIQKGMEEAGSELNLFGGGLYLTDDLYTASTYQGKNKAKAFNKWEPASRKPAPGEQVGIVYEVDFDADDVKFYDLDKKASPEVIKYFEETFDDELVGSVEWEISGDDGGFGDRSLGELIRAAQGFSSYEGIPAYEIQQMISWLKDKLKEDGYRGFSHKGGLLAGNKKRTHDVKILWTDDISTPIYQDTVDVVERLRKPEDEQAVAETATQESLFPSSVLSAVEAEGAAIQASESVESVKRLNEELENQLRVLSDIQTTAEQLESLAEGGTVRSAREQAMLARSSERQQKAVIKKIRNQIGKVEEALLDVAVEEQHNIDPVVEELEAAGVTVDPAPEDNSILSVTDEEIDLIAEALRLDPAAEATTEATTEADPRGFGLGPFGEAGESLRHMIKRVFFKDTSTGALKWDPTKMRKWTRAGVKALHGTLAPRVVVDAVERSLAKRSVWVNTAGRITSRVDEEIQKIPEADRDKAIEQSNAFLLGEDAAKHDGFNLLPKELQDVLREARMFLDSLTSSIVDFGILGEKLSETLQTNIGKYLLRAYKMFDPNANWNWDTVPEEIKQEARAWVIQKAKSIAAEGKKGRGKIKDVIAAIPTHLGPDWVDVVKSVVEGDAKSTLQNRVDHLLSQILPGQNAVDADYGVEWLVGNSKTGRAPVSSFMKRGDIVEPIRALMGEVKGPILNIVGTADRLSKIRQAYTSQLEIAKLGLSLGFFKKGDAGKLPNWRPLVADQDLALRGLKGVYAPEGLDTYIKNYLMGKDQVNTKFLQKLRRAVGVGKFSQVVLNLDTWATAVYGALFADLSAARLISFKTDGSMRNFYSPAIDAVKDSIAAAKQGNKLGDTAPIREALASESASDFLKNNGVDRILKTPGLLGDLATEYGALEEGLLTRELLDAGDITQDSLEDVLGRKGGKLGLPTRLAKSMSKAYGVADRVIAKKGAFLNELITYAKAASETGDSSMEEVFRKASDIVKQTTPTPSKVPQGVRVAGALGFSPTYLTFPYETFRNTYNIISLAKEELQSPSKSLRRRGGYRLASIIGVLLAGAAGMVGQVVGYLKDALSSDDDDSEQLRGMGSEVMEKRNALRALVPEYHQADGLDFFGYNEGEDFIYAASSYLNPFALPGAVVGVPTEILRAGGSAGDAAEAAIRVVAESLFGFGILTETVMETALNSKKSGRGTIYNEELGVIHASGQALGHNYEKVFKPGAHRKYTRWRDSKDKALGYHGQVYQPSDEVLRIIGLRVGRINIPRSIKANMASFDRRFSDAKSIYSNKPGYYKNTPERKEESEATIKVVTEDYQKFIAKMKHLVPERDLRTFESNYYEGTENRRSGVARELAKSW